MSKKININESSAWSELDWDDQDVPKYLKKSDQQVAVARASRLRVRSIEEKQKSSESNKKFRKENPRTDAEKRACGNNMRGKTLEEILGKEKALKGRKSRSEILKEQYASGKRDEVGKKTAATRKANGSYDGRSMRGKSHKESTKDMQSKKAQIRQDLKRTLNLGKNDSIPKELLLKEYQKHGL